MDTTTRPRPAVARPARIRQDALRDLAAVSPGIVAFGVFLGLGAARTGQGPEAVVGALLVFGGSAQLTTLTSLHLGAGLLTALASGVAVNASPGGSGGPLPRSSRTRRSCRRPGGRRTRARRSAATGGG
jgi:hypothetical protein